MTIVLIETVAGKCLGSRGKKSQEEEKLKKKKNPDKDPKTPDTVQMVERWVDNIDLYPFQKKAYHCKKRWVEGETFFTFFYFHFI